MSARESVIPVFVPHLGCPNDCVFCDQRRISGAASPATAEDVRRAVEAAAASSANNGGGRQLAFYGGSFTAIPAWQQEELLGAAQPYLADGTLSSLRLSTRPDAIDGEVLALARQNAKRAGVGSLIEFSEGDARKFDRAAESGVIVTNPPYGERLMDKKGAEQLYREFGKAYSKLSNWKLYCISSHPEFEQFFGKRADKRRKLYNGMIKCELYMYL